MKYFLILFLILGAIPAAAQVEQIEARVGTVTCAACFNLAVAGLKQLPGAAEVSGDMNDAWIRVVVNGKQGIVIKDVMDRIRVAGFKEDGQFTITASGQMEQRGNRMVLVVPHQKEVFVVDPGEREQMALNAASSRNSVRASGQIHGSGNQYEIRIQKLQIQ